MSDWQAQLLRDVRRALHESLWPDGGSDGIAGAGRIHLAVLVEPYLSGIMGGGKTVESRFSRHRCPPYGAVAAGDAVILKRSAGPVVGICRVASAEFHEVGPGTMERIRRDHGDRLGIPAGERRAFWAGRAGMKYATLLRVGDVRPLPPIACTKRDQRAWVVLRTVPAPTAS